MKKIILFLILGFCLNCCKKNTTIKVNVFNPLIQKNVANAKIVLVEQKQELGLNSNITCKEIAELTSDNQGFCFIDKTKLKVRKNYTYFCAIKESWGVSQSYPCIGKTSGFINVGEINEVTVIDDLAGSFSIQYNNLFYPSALGDSLVVFPKRLEFPNPKGGTVGGGGVSGGGVYVSNGANNYPPSFSNIPDKLSGIIVISIRKRKLGVLTIITDTVIAYPNQNTKAYIDW